MNSRRKREESVSPTRRADVKNRTTISTRVSRTQQRESPSKQPFLIRGRTRSASRIRSSSSAATAAAPGAAPGGHLLAITGDALVATRRMGQRGSR